MNNSKKLNAGFVTQRVEKQNKTKLLPITFLAFRLLLVPKTGVDKLRTILLLGAFGMSIGLAANAADLPSRCVAIAGTNDLHGVILPHSYEQFGHRVQVGGVLIQSGYIQRLRESFGERFLLLDGGDLFQGTLSSNFSKGAAIITAYNAMGYTAASIGNHEFDFGPKNQGNPDRLGVLKERLKQADFPFLAANIFEKTTGDLVQWPNTKPSMLVQKGEISIGIIGITTPSTPYTTRPINVRTLDFTDPTPIILGESQRLREAGAQLIVLLTHMGGSCKSTKDANDLTSCHSGGELFPILKKLPKGTVDIAVGGHTHGFVSHWVNGTATIESGARGRFLGLVEACVDDKGVFDRKATILHQPIELCWNVWVDGECKRQSSPSVLGPAKFMGKVVKPTEALKKQMQPYLEKVNALRNKELNVLLPHPYEREEHDCSLGVLVAESARVASKADVGLQNLGGVRADLPAGEIIYGMAFEVLPFGNQIATLDLTLSQLLELIALMEQRHGKLPYIAGVRVKEHDGKRILTTDDDTVLDSSRIYRVATNDYLVGGGVCPRLFLAEKTSNTF